MRNLILLTLFIFISALPTFPQTQPPSKTPQSKEAKRAAKLEEKQRKEREKEAAKQAERQAKYEENRPINRTSSYDRFKDLTTYNMDKMLVLGNNDYKPVIYGIANIWLTGGYYIEGKNWEKPEQIIFQFEVLEAYWEFRDSDNRNLILLVDGERLNLGKMGQEEFNVRYVGNLEKLFVPLSYKMFAKIANAKKIEAQLGRLEFSFDTRHLQGLLNLIEPPLIESSGDVPSVGNVVGLAVYRVNPSYSKKAKELKLSGAVKIEVLIDESGNVISATGISGDPILIESAIEAAKQWKFDPTTVSKQGGVGSVRGILIFNFNL